MLDQILVDYHLPTMDDNESSPRDEEETFRPPRPMGLVSEERALLEMANGRGGSVGLHGADTTCQPHPKYT